MLYRRVMAAVCATMLLILFNISQCIWMSSAIFHKVARPLLPRLPCRNSVLYLDKVLANFTLWVGVWGRRSRPHTPTIGEAWRGLRPRQASPNCQNAISHGPTYQLPTYRP